MISTTGQRQINGCTIAAAATNAVLVLEIKPADFDFIFLKKNSDGCSSYEQKNARIILSCLTQFFQFKTVLRRIWKLGTQETWDFRPLTELMHAGRSTPDFTRFILSTKTIDAPNPVMIVRSPCLPSHGRNKSFMSLL
jgi:hypothetical protein